MLPYRRHVGQVQAKRRHRRAVHSVQRLGVLEYQEIHLPRQRIGALDAHLYAVLPHLSTHQ